MADPDGDTIYTVTVSEFTSGDLAIYKFVWSKTTAPNGNWESPQEGDDIFGNDKNRIYGVHDGSNEVSRFWNNQNPDVILADGEIFFEVDMSVLDELGLFNPDVDSVQIKGAFNGWNANDPGRALMTQNAGNPDDWYIYIPFVQQVLNSNQYYKFFIKNGSGSTPYANGGWEVALGYTTSGDRNRSVIFKGEPAQEAHAALGEVLDEGLEARWARHKAADDALVAGLSQIGLELFPDPAHCLYSLNAVRIPPGVDEKAVRAQLRSRHHIEIGAGLGPLAGRIWRIGLMGCGATVDNVQRVVSALADALGRKRPR